MEINSEEISDLITFLRDVRETNQDYISFRLHKRQNKTKNVEFDFTKRFNYGKLDSTQTSKRPQTKLGEIKKGIVPSGKKGKRKRNKNLTRKRRTKEFENNENVLMNKKEDNGEDLKINLGKVKNELSIKANIQDGKNSISLKQNDSENCINSIKEERNSDSFDIVKENFQNNIQTCGFEQKSKDLKLDLISNFSFHKDLNSNRDLKTKKHNLDQLKEDSHFDFSKIGDLTSPKPDYGLKNAENIRKLKNIQREIESVVRKLQNPQGNV